MLFTEVFIWLQFDWLLKKPQSIYFKNDCMISDTDNPFRKYWKKENLRCLYSFVHILILKMD